MPGVRATQPIDANQIGRAIIGAKVGLGCRVRGDQSPGSRRNGPAAMEPVIIIYSRLGGSAGGLMILWISLGCRAWEIWLWFDLCMVIQGGLKPVG